MTIDYPASTSTFEVLIGPRFDVGAPEHAVGEEIFYVVEGELDVLVFEPIDRAVGDWHRWESATGQTFATGGPGTFMFVPPGIPHAFSNSSDEPVKVFFQSSVIRQGHHEREGLWETGEAGVVVLITQRPQFQILPPMPFTQVRCSFWGVTSRQSGRAICDKRAVEAAVTMAGHNGCAFKLASH